MNDAKLKAAVAGSGLAGVVVAVANGDGLTFEAAYGVTDFASGAAMTSDSRFQIASMTKAITSVGALQCVERGLLSRDEPVSRWLPELADPQVITGFDNAGAPLLRPAARPITLRHLLTHTSGLGYDFMNVTQAQWRATQGEAPPHGSKAALMAPLLFDPGDRWEYGTNTDWVGLAVEAATGETLDVWCAREIFAPLGMTATSFAMPHDPAQLASLYVRGEDGGLFPFPTDFNGPDEREFNAGGAGLKSTASDYLRFCRMVLNGGMLDGHRILSADSIALLTTNQIGSLTAGKMATTMPMMALPYESFPGMDCGWSLGFLINPETGPNGRSAGSLAWAGLANCYYWIDPAQGLAAVFLAQLLPFGDPQALAAAHAFERMVYGLD
jgi:methyl acetate hydrolase